MKIVATFICASSQGQRTHSARTNCATDRIKEKAEVIEKKGIKCRYNNRGFCKSQAECVYHHSDKICDKLLSNGQCPEPKTCILRHPRDCRYWAGDTRGCLRGVQCKYLHTSAKKGVNIKIKKSYHETKSEEQKKTDNNETTTEKKGDKSTDSLKDEFVKKDNLIKDKEEMVSKLKSEIERLVEENNRIKQCA